MLQQFYILLADDMLRVYFCLYFYMLVGRMCSEFCFVSINLFSEKLLTLNIEIHKWILLTTILSGCNLCVLCGFSSANASS